MQAVAMTVSRASRPRTSPGGRPRRRKGGRRKAHTRVLALPYATVAVTSMASMRALGMGGKAKRSTVLRGGRLLIELNLRCRIDAHDGQFTRSRSTWIHVHLEMCAPRVRGTGRSPPVLYAAGLYRAGCPTWWRRKGRTGSGRRDYMGHDGRWERRNMDMLEIISLGPTNVDQKS